MWTDDRDSLLDVMLGEPGSSKKLRRAIRTIWGMLDSHGLVHKSRYKGLIEDISSQLDDIKAVISDNPDLAQSVLMYLIECLSGEANPDEDELEPDMDEMEMAAGEPLNSEGESGYQDVTDQRQPGKKALKPNPALWQPPYTDPGTAVVANRLNLGQGGRYGINLNSSNLDALFGHNAERPALVVPLNKNDVRARTQPQDNLNQAGFWDGNLPSPFAGLPKSRRGR